MSAIKPSTKITACVKQHALNKTLHFFTLIIVVAVDLDMQSKQESNRQSVIPCHFFHFLYLSADQTNGFQDPTENIAKIK